MKRIARVVAIIPASIEPPPVSLLLSAVALPFRYPAPNFQRRRPSYRLRHHAHGLPPTIQHACSVLHYALAIGHSFD